MVPSANYVWIVEDVAYYPVFGSVLADGRLRIATAGTSADGERWDGYALIGPEHAYYKTWRAIVENRERIRGELKDKWNQERAQRRRRAKLENNVEDE